MAGNVCDEDAKLLAFEHEKIVEISCDGTHRKVARGNFYSGEARDYARKNRCLDLLGNLKLFLDSDKALLPGENAVCNKISEGANEEKKTCGFNIASGNQVKAGENGMKYEETENGKPKGDNSKFAWEPAGWAEK